MNSDKLNQLKIDTRAKSRPKAAFWLIVVFVVLVTAVAIYFAWPKSNDSRRLIGSKKPSAVTNSTVVAPPQRSNDALLTISGYIVNRERIELSPRFLGVVNWIGVKKGDAVTNGQIVVLLDDAEQKARVAESRGRVTNAQVSVAKAELDYNRVRALSATQVESKQAEDDARLRVDSARASMTEAEANLQLAQTYLNWTVIRSPIDGVVLEKLVDPSELVVPQSFGGGRGPSTALIALANPKDLQVEIDLNEADLAKVFLNQKCRVSPEAYPDKTYGGYVAEIAPEANRQKGTLQIKVQIQEPDKFLTPELNAKVEFLPGKKI
ncbi:MAG: efflux RND transporter periplasmic adaptor subunit [Verrucomicrobiota bacterium]